MNKEQKTLYREKSMRHFSSPDQINKCIQVTNYNMWFVLIAIVILLVGFFIWATFGYVFLNQKAEGIAKDGIITCYVPSDSGVTAGMEVRIEDKRDLQNKIPDIYGRVSDVSLSQTYYQNITDESVYEINLDQSFLVTIEAEGMMDGIKKVTIIEGKIHPISFLFGFGG